MKRKEKIKPLPKRTGAPLPKTIDEIKLSDYVKKTKAQGYPPEKIRETLSGCGWSVDSINKVLGKSAEPKRVPKTAKRNEKSEDLVSTAPGKTTKEVIITSGAYQVKTKLDDLLSIVDKDGPLTFIDAAHRLDVDKKTIEKWGNILEEQDLLEISYPVVGSPLLVSKNDTKRK